MSADKRNFLEQLNDFNSGFARIQADEHHLDPRSERINIQNAVVALAGCVFALDIPSSLQPVSRVKPRHTSSAL